MAGQLEGKVALVTGGSSGIGRATVLAFAAQGATVVIADVDDAAAEEVVDAVRLPGGVATFVHTDVADENQVQAMVETTVETYGRLDCAVNNAGIGGVFAPTADYPREVWDRVIAVNLTGTWLCVKHEIPQMLAGGGGAIVNTSSISGLQTGGHISAYCASKHAVIGITRSAAREYSKAGIRVNAVCPGGTETPLLDELFEAVGDDSAYLARHAIGRYGQPSEVAEAAVWLCSDAASFITGAAIPVDGGFMA